MIPSGYPAGAATDKNAPWKRGDMDPRDRTKIEDRANELAADAFNRRDQDACEWLRETEELEEMAWGLVGAVELPNDPDTSLRNMALVERVRAAYVQACSHIYLEQAKSEVLELENED